MENKNLNLSMLLAKRNDLINDIVYSIVFEHEKDEIIDYYKKHPLKSFFIELEYGTGVNKQLFFCCAVWTVIALIGAMICSNFKSELEGTYWLNVIWGLFWTLLVVFIALIVRTIIFLMINIWACNKVIKNDKEIESIREQLTATNKKTGHDNKDTEAEITIRYINTQIEVIDYDDIMNIQKQLAEIEKTGQ